MKTSTAVHAAWTRKLAVPAFNIPYLPMMAPVVQASADEDAFCLAAVARLEWIKFESRSMEAVIKEFFAQQPGDQIRIHLDHIPVIDEDNQEVPFIDLIAEAIDLGYQSVMVDGSRLSLDENIRATRKVVIAARRSGVPVEAELGAVMGHEGTPVMSYEEMLRTKTGFTKPDEARRFVEETGCDWLSVAFGNIHGAVSETLRHDKKIAARLDIDHLKILQDAAGIPLVLHGGSGIPRKSIRRAMEHGVAKINIGTELRQTYEQTLKHSSSIDQAQLAVYEQTRTMLRDFFGVSGTAGRIA